MEVIEHRHLKELGFTKEALAPFFAGLAASDGHVEGPHRTTIASKSSEFMEQVIHPVADEQGYQSSVFWDEGAGVYKLSTYDAKLTKELAEKYNVPSRKKAHLIRPPKGLDSFEELWNIRGWFDGEGGPEELTKYHGGTEYHYPRVGLNVTREPIWNWIASFLQNEGVRVSTYDREDGSHGLWINGYEECREFCDLIGFRHPEQNRKLRELLTREKWGSSARGAG